MDFHLLTSELRRRFEEDGFLIVRGALGAGQVAELNTAGDRLIAGTDLLDRQTGGDSYDGFRNVVGRDAAFTKLLTHGSTVSLVLQLMSANLQLHTSHLIHKRPEAADADPMRLDPGWHRDINTVNNDLGWQGNQRFEIKVAYYLSDARAANSGVTMVARGSHRWNAAPRMDAEGNPPGMVLPELAPGDALLFENRTYHAARLNTSAITRKCVIFGYSYRWMRPDDWLEQPEELLAKLDPIGRELLTPMRHRAPDGRFSPCADRGAIKAWAYRHLTAAVASAKG